MYKRLGHESGAVPADHERGREGSARCPHCGARLRHQALIPVTCARIGGPRSQFSAVLSGGMTNDNSIELTGIGAGQAVDWKYSYAQARANYRNWFAQAYVNMSDAGETFLLRNGAPDYGPLEGVRGVNCSIRPTWARGRASRTAQTTLPRRR